MIAWLGVIFVIPYLGIPLYLLIGSRKSALRIAQAPGPRSVKVIDNLEFRLIPSGELAFEKLLEQIHEATRSIDLLTFIFARDATGQAVLDALTRKARQGVRVRVLIDGLGSSRFIRPNFSTLIQAGGEVRIFSPVSGLFSRGKLNLRNHRKLVVLDQKRAWFGGMNIATEYLGEKSDPIRWIDLAFMLEGDSALQMLNVIEADWSEADQSSSGKQADNRPDIASPLRTLPNYATALTSPESASARHRIEVLPTGPGSVDDPLYNRILQSCFDARSRIWITTPYFVPDESLNRALVLAARRGVDVRVLLPLKSNHLSADLARGTYLRELIEVGAQVRLHPRMIHAKLVVFDKSIAITGSANFDLRSLLFNHELGVLLHSLGDIEDAARWMEPLWTEANESLPRSGFLRSLGEGVGRLFGALL